MSLTIEDTFVELQKKATHVLVDQKVIIFDQEQIDTFLDKINGIKSKHKAVIVAYREAIECVVDFIKEDRIHEELISISESINNLVSTTKRLIKTSGDVKLKGCFISEIKAYKILINDFKEILEDIQLRIDGDQEIHDLLKTL